MASIKKVASWYRGHATDIQAAVDAGILERFSVVFNIDDNTLSIYDTDKTLKSIVGVGTTSMYFADVLPPVEEGNTRTLYIVGDTIYVFDGYKYQPQYIDYSTDIIQLQTDVTALQTMVDGHTSDIGTLYSFLELVEV